MPQKHKTPSSILSITKKPKGASHLKNRKTKKPKATASNLKKIKPPSLSLVVKVKDQKLKQQEQALKVKSQALKEYQKAIKKSSQLMEEVTKILAQQLKIAQEIHHTLLPSELPVIPHCEFSFKFQPAKLAESMGKDFYEITPHPADRSFSLTLSSSTSHSLSALLFSARLKMMSRTQGGKPLFPEEFLNQLRAEILPFSSSPPSLSLANSGSQKKYKKPYIAFSRAEQKKGPSHTLLQKGSLFHALINQKTYQMVYSLVGDIAVLVQYAENGNNIKVLKKTATSLEQKGESQTIYLNGQDRLIVLSAGVLNTRSLEGKNYSIAQVKKILQEEKKSLVHDLRNRIFYELKAFSKGCPAERDQSVLVMEVKKGILKLST